MKIFYWLGIKFYQHVLSPKKGFKCAYGKLHGGTGCSGAILETLMTKGLKQGKNDILDRLDACKAAYTELSIRTEDKNNPKKKKGNGCLAEMVESAGEAVADCGPSKCDIGDCSGCDLSISIFLRRFL